MLTTPKTLLNSLEFRSLPVAEKIHAESDCLAGRAGCQMPIR